MTNNTNYRHFILNTTDWIDFKLIRKINDLKNNAIVFHPTMTEQILGDANNNFDSQDLKVHLFYTANALDIYLGIEYKAIGELSLDHKKADNVIGAIAKILPKNGYFTNIAEFLQALHNANTFKPYGKKLTEHTTVFGLKKGFQYQRRFEIYYCNSGVPFFQQYFMRLQTFIMWFMGETSYVNFDDPRWSYFVCYERYLRDRGDSGFAVCGYTTVYEFYAYPQNRRPRINQMLVLPPFQRVGIGTAFLKTIHNFYQSQSDVIDITVQKPTEDFQRLRNFCYAQLCQNLPVFLGNAIKRPFSKDMIQEAREKFKINERQTRIIYEILRLYHTNPLDRDDYQGFRLEVKKRLNSSYYKQLTDIRKIEQLQMDTELVRGLLPTMQERFAQLHAEFEEVEAEYNRIIAKMHIRS